MRFLAITLIALVLGGCDRYALVEKFSTPELQAEAKDYIAKLRSRDFAAIESAIDESLKSGQLPAELTKMADLIPAGEPTLVRLVGAQHHFSGETNTYSSQFEYLFDRKSVVISISIRESGGPRKIVGFEVVPQAMPVDEQSLLSWDGKGLPQYAVLAGAVAAFLVSLVALVKCARTRLPRRKWLWILFILVGFTKLSVNWDTGELGFMPVALQIMSASIGAPTLGPTVVAFSIPVGALLFLIRYRKGSEVSRALHAATADPA